jgi:hypothetical protein
MRVPSGTPKKRRGASATQTPSAHSRSSFIPFAGGILRRRRCVGDAPGSRLRVTTDDREGEPRREGDGMIEKTIENWHRCIAGKLPGGLDELLAEDVVFHSPIVFTPQKGRDVAKLYLTAAGGTFGVDLSKGGGKGKSTFHYTKEVMSGNHAVLEFEVEVGGKYVNGVDIITCNAEGKITEFRVMIRPLQAVNMMHQQMMAMLEKMKGAPR